MELFKEKSFDEAIRHYEAKLTSTPSENKEEMIKLLQCIASCQYCMELYRKTIKSCLKVIELDKTDVNALVLMGKSYHKIGGNSAALQAFHNALNAALSKEDLLNHVLITELINDFSGANNALNKTQSSSNLKSANSASSTSSSSSSKKSKSNRGAKDKDSAGAPAVTIAELQVYHRKFIGNGTGQISSVFLQQIRSNLSHAMGEDTLDDLIAYGYLQVNTGKLDLAVEIFGKLLRHRKDMIGANLGLGSALAMKGSFDDAIDSFSRAILLDPTQYDSWKRRGQTRLARMLHLDAINDLDRAIELGGDGDCYTQRGLAYHQAKNFRKAIADLRIAEAKGENTITLYNHVGMCEGQLGNIEASLAGYKAAITLDPKFREGLLNYAQMFKEIGDSRNALVLFQRALDLEPGGRYLQGRSYRGFLYHSMGKIEKAIDDMEVALSLKRTDEQLLMHMGIWNMAIGRYSIAENLMTTVLAINPDNIVWYHRQIIIYYWNKLDENIQEWSIDAEMAPYIKEGLSKKIPRKHFSNTVRKADKFKDSTCPDDIHDLTSFDIREVDGELLSRSAHLGQWMQLDAPGFIRNHRQHRQFGLAVMQMATQLKRHADLVRNGLGGLKIRDTASSRKYAFHTTSSSGSTASDISSPKGKSSHSFGWRDFFDIAVKWRQVSEPNDAVWWIDGLTTQAFEDGFGLQTPIVNGQLKTIRYYSYFDKAFALTKKHLRMYYYNAAGQEEKLKEKQLEQLESADTLEKLYSVVGKDFYVIAPCRSKRDPSLVFEGTRLTIVESSPDGFEFTIRTPGTPDRWKVLDAEMDFAFHGLVNALIAEPYDADIVLRKAMQLFYYWVIFCPLSRGSAACGSAALLASIVSTGDFFDQPIPRSKQLDWEAIFLDCDEFTNQEMEWLTRSPLPFDINEEDVWVNDNDNEYDVCSGFGDMTLRNMISMLNYNAN